MQPHDLDSRGEVVVFQDPVGQVQVHVRLEEETVWLSLTQIAMLFDRHKSVISRHLRNTFASGELDRAAVVAKSATTASDGKDYQVEFFNLDAILSVGYRVNSVRGTQFRIWATRTLRDHLLRGYTINQQRFAQNARELEAALLLARKAAAAESLSTDQGRGLVDVIARYTQTFLLLQRFDEGLLEEPRGTTGGTLPHPVEARAGIAHLKQDLTARREATDLFGREREDALAALLGNLDQSVFGDPAYPTIESKAAHLLYFVIKNHPFTDGNKRIGSFLFVDFLHRNGHLMRGGEAVINDVGLAALALLVAESDPKDKDVMIRLVMNMLAVPAAERAVRRGREVAISG
jgi:prophage maintenance system killer protein